MRAFSMAYAAIRFSSILMRRRFCRVVSAGKSPRLFPPDIARSRTQNRKAREASVNESVRIAAGMSVLSSR